MGVSWPPWPMTATWPSATHCTTRCSCGPRSAWAWLGYSPLPFPVEVWGPLRGKWREPERAPGTLQPAPETRGAMSRAWAGSGALGVSAFHNRLEATSKGPHQGLFLERAAEETASRGSKGVSARVPCRGPCSPGARVRAQCLQLCLTLCDPMDCILPGSSVRGISQARILEWVAFPFPGDLPHPGIE